MADDQRNASSYDDASVIAKALNFYVPLAAAAECPLRTNSTKEVTEDIARHIDGMLFDRPALIPLPSSAAAAGNGTDRKVYDAIEKELDAVRKNLTECQKATFYVTPSGTLIHQDLPACGNPTLCIDTSSFTLDRPFEIEVAAYPAHSTQQSSTRIPTIMASAWPGAPTELVDPVFSHKLPPSVVRPA